MKQSRITRTQASELCVSLTEQDEDVWLEKSNGYCILLTKSQAKDAVKKLILWLEKSK